MRSASKSFKIPLPLLEAVNALRQPGQPLADYASDNAAIVGLIRYAIAFPRRHTLTAGIARLPTSEQDEIDDFLAALATNGGHLAGMVSKPATAEALLQEARRHRNAGKSVTIGLSQSNAPAS